MSFSYSPDTEKETMGRMQRDCWLKLKMAAVPAFKLLSAVMIGFGFKSVLGGKGTGINSIMVAT